MLGYLPVEHDKMDVVRERVIGLWEDVVSEVKTTPLFPVIHIADIFEILTPFIGMHPRFRPLADQVDELVSTRAGADAAADRARRRAIADLDSGHRVLAIDELHRAKIGWFTGDTMEGSILAMLTISDCYYSPRMPVAARYYAAGALFITLRSESDEVKRHIGRAAFAIADTFEAAGEGVTFLHSIRPALMAHEMSAIDPGDWEKHPQVKRTIAHAAILRAIARRLAPDLLPLVDTAIAEWPLPPDERDGFIELSQGPPWSTASITDIEGQIAHEFGQHPFSDIGDRRSVEWSALGVRWTVRSVAHQDTWFAALEIAAALQIVQIEFADLDLVLIPSAATIDVDLRDLETPMLSQLPDNGRLAWKIVMPKVGPREPSFVHPASVAIAILGQTTALPFDAFQQLATERIERGLPLRAFSVRPIRELMAFAEPENLDRKGMQGMQRPAFAHSLEPIEADDLKWRSGPGPGYTRARAEGYLRNRYRVTMRALRLTLPRLLADERSWTLINELKQKGLLDWQVLTIIANIVEDWQLKQQLPPELPPRELAERVRERLLREERDTDPIFDLNQFTADLVRVHESILTIVALRTWDLQCHRQTPDFIATKRLLDETSGTGIRRTTFRTIVHSSDLHETLSEKRSPASLPCIDNESPEDLAKLQRWTFLAAAHQRSSSIARRIDHPSNEVRAALALWSGNAAAGNALIAFLPGFAGMASGSEQLPRGTRTLPRGITFGDEARSIERNNVEAMIMLVLVISATHVRCDRVGACARDKVQSSPSPGACAVSRTA
jgi:hypothetical protein